jgi:hypothetical protein
VRGPKSHYYNIQTIRLTSTYTFQQLVSIWKPGKKKCFRSRMCATFLTSASAICGYELYHSGAQKYKLRRVHQKCGSPQLQFLDAIQRCFGNTGTTISMLHDNSMPFKICCMKKIIVCVFSCVLSSGYKCTSKLWYSLHNTDFQHTNGSSVIYSMTL